ncbi:MAG: hypothetical protein JOS17DRAFT_830393 [Linnemannia elongata]|nr:MAG: hypothetical protein JOS17DRAFT_830393 [Linnemannia elongata]
MSLVERGQTAAVRINWSLAAFNQESRATVTTFLNPNWRPCSANMESSDLVLAINNILVIEDIPYEVPALPLRRVKQKRLRVQTRPTPQTKPDLKSLAGEEEEHPCEASSSSSPPSSSVQLPSAPSIVQSESVNASYQQKSDTPFQEQHQAPQPVQHSQQRFYQQQSIAPNSGRRPLYGLSPKEAAARSLQPNATVYPVSLSQHMDKKKEVPLSKRMRYIGWSDIQKALIQWMKTGDTLTRVCSKENAGPLGIGKVYEEVAELVKEKTSRWDFNSESARQEIGNIVRRVRGANIVTNSTGSGTYGNRKIEEQREALCPEYKDLWPVVQGIPNTKFAGLTKSSLPPILHCSKPLTPRPLAPLPHTSFKLQPPPPAVAAIVAAAENIESEDDEADRYIDPDDGLRSVDSDRERISVSGPSGTLPKAVDLISNANSIAKKLLAVLDKYDADGERKSDERLKLALYLFKDQRERVGQLEKRVEELLEKNDALREKYNTLRVTNCQLRIEIQRLKSVRDIANE